MTSLDRRSFLLASGAAAVLGPALLDGPAVARLDGPAVARGTGPFRHGVASGDPLPSGVLLWTRVTPVDAALPGSGAGPDVSVRWQVAADPGFRRVVRSGKPRPTGKTRNPQRLEPDQCCPQRPRLLH